ncbi:hypothetical protein [Campylobacter lari]|uniref:hypothetical protein n=1 Tax=Campylobacter lari TaxID=201 RepID=UPI001F08AE79|nr:hypothetical protein [Campylobacter lari]MCH3687705.1 hypothetical protein [Campylobacter lari]
MIWKGNDLLKLKYSNIKYNKVENNFIIKMENQCRVHIVIISNIFNKNSFDINNIILEFSINKKDWFVVDKTSFIINNFLEIYINSDILTQYIRFSIKDEIVFEIENCDIYTKKHSGLILSALRGGYGDKIISMLNAMYISRHTKLKFGYAWSDIYREHLKVPEKIKTESVGKEEEIFAKEFIDEFSYSDKKEVVFNLYNCGFREDIANYEKKQDYYYGNYINHGVLQYIIGQIDSNYSLEYKDLFHQISFSEKIKKVFSLADDTFNKYFKNYKVLGIHIRSGAIVYSVDRDRCITHYENKATPVEMALSIIKLYYCGFDKIIIFGEDYDSINNLVSYCKKTFFKEILIAKDLIPASLDDTEIDFFEIKFMSLCSEIVSNSGFARLASLCGNGREPKGWKDIFTLEEKFNLLNEYIGKIDSDKFQKAYSYLCLYMISKRLQKPNKILIDTLNKAIFYDSDNVAYKILIVNCYIGENNYSLAEEQLKKVNIKRFLYVLFEFWKYLNNHVELIFSIDKKLISDFPYLYFLYYKISLFLNNENKIEIGSYVNRVQVVHNTAKARIQNQLSYKLGQAMIINSKSFLGYIRMPFVLSYIKDKHKQEQKIYQEKIKKDPSLKLPPLEDYPDYQEALKEKECLTYKLGEALIKANKTWYKGGYVRMWFEVKKLKVRCKN